jgi:hypothetical protein
VHHHFAEGRKGFAQALGHVAQHLQKLLVRLLLHGQQCIQLWTKNPIYTKNPVLDVLSKISNFVQFDPGEPRMTRNEPARYIDPRTGRHHELSERRWRSDDGNPMMVTPLPGIARDDIDSRNRSLWRYRAALPVAIDKPASMGEGCTPLVQKRWGEHEPHFKLEWFNPTCSFKDRGAAVMMSFLRQIGVDAVLEDSSGNGGAAIAAAGAAAGINVKGWRPATHPRPRWRRSTPSAPRCSSCRGRARNPNTKRYASPNRSSMPAQLASVLPAGHEDAGLRTLGRPGLRGAPTTW